MKKSIVLIFVILGSNFFNSKISYSKGWNDSAQESKKIAWDIIAYKESIRLSVIMALFEISQSGNKAVIENGLLSMLDTSIETIDAINDKNSPHSEAINKSLKDAKKFKRDHPFNNLEQ